MKMTNDGMPALCRFIRKMYNDNNNNNMRKCNLLSQF
jgi:hypothetical protein